jgi:hypothetical protein
VVVKRRKGYSVKGPNGKTYKAFVEPKKDPKITDAAIIEKNRT